jgi:YHS domain-containing protein
MEQWLQKVPRMSFGPSNYRGLVILLCVALIACPRSRPRTKTARPATDIQTIDSGDVHPAVLEPPPVVNDLGPAPKTNTDLIQQDVPPPPTPQDEALRASLPFAPAIALDPVDGNKISIRVNTPTTEYKNKIFYFSSEATKRTFLASPDQYLKGVFATPR